MTKLFKAIISWHGGEGEGAKVAFAKAMGVSQPTVTRWCAGGPISVWLRPKMAQVLGISEAVLDEISPPKIKGEKFAEVVDARDKTPVVGVVNGKDEYFLTDFDTKTPMEEHIMPTTGDYGEKLKGIKISGKLGKLAADGDYVYISQTAKPENGSFIVVRLNEGHSFKKITLAGKFAILESLTGGGSLRLPIMALNIVGVVRFVLSRR